MTKEYRITTKNLSQTSDNDCYIAPDDPMYPLLTASVMGGLGAQQRLAEYNELTAENNISKIQQQRIDAQAMGIKPGTPAWFAMFPKP